MEAGALWVFYNEMALIPLSMAKPKRLQLLIASPWAFNSTNEFLEDANTQSMPERVLFTCCCESPAVVTVEYDEWKSQNLRVRGPGRTFKRVFLNIFSQGNFLLLFFK